MHKKQNKKPFIEITSGDISISPFDANHIPDYEAPENFPNCCEHHKGVFEQAQKWFTTFPNCCDQHKAMAKKYWFDYWLKENNYSGVTIANKIVRQLSYTEQVISKKITIENWYKYITDYIDYNVSSFGQPAIGLHIYLGRVKHYIHETPELPETKRQSLIDFIEKEYYTAPKEEKTKTDFNLLFNIYQDWVKAFPFELNSYFGNLKQQYEKQLPIIDGTPEVNTFTGVVKAKIVTKEKLFQVLINLTDNLLKQVNGVTLYEKGLLTEPDKIKLELIIAERKNKLKEGYKYNSPDETTRYKKMIQFWFNDEKKFFKEITPLLKASTIKQTKPKGEPLPVEIKPAVIPEQVQHVYDILKDFFSTEEQTELKTILETGNNATTKLLFKANGNRLTDTFKKLIENDFIIGCEKQDLIKWIISNFNYFHRKAIKDYTPDTVEKTISRNDNPCKRPLIRIVNGQIKKSVKT